MTEVGRQDKKLDTRIGKATTEMRAWDHSVVKNCQKRPSAIQKRPNCQKSAKPRLSIFKAVSVPILTYGHENWVMTDGVRSLAQASEISFFDKF